MPRYPERVICLTEETVEILYLLGRQDNIVGVSGFAVRPPEARRKPKISTFTDARYDEIDALSPDLIFAFSDVQADLVRDLIRRGHTVCTFNQRTIAEILQVIQTVASIMDCADEGQRLVKTLEDRLAVRQDRPSSARPRIYFEEWYDPMISCIGWVSELIEIAGGENVFAEKSMRKAARDRVVSSEEVIEASPEIMIGSWCGKMFKPESVQIRPGWDKIPAVRDGNLFDIPSSIILQPGPAALSDGLDALRSIIARVEKSVPASPK